MKSTLTFSERYGAYLVVVLVALLVLLVLLALLWLSLSPGVVAAAVASHGSVRRAVVALALARLPTAMFATAAALGAVPVPVSVPISLLSLLATALSGRPPPAVSSPC